MGTHLLCLAFIIMAWLLGPVPCDAYHPGDFVSLARRGQYHSMRTHWHDVLGRHLPRFAISHEAVLPIPRPVGFDSNDAYKLSLSFGKERFTTPWLLVVGLKTGAVPMVDVTLAHFGEELRGVRAKVTPMPVEYVERHAEVVRNYQNSSHWPKFIVIRYKWQEQAEVDVALGLYVLFGSSVALTTLLAIHILQSHKDKLAKLIADNVSEGPAGEIAKIE